MKVNQPNTTPASGLTQPPASKPVKDNRQASGAAGASDHVQLSNLSAHLTASFSGSPSKMNRMSVLTAAVSGGSYHVDAAVVSHSIIQDTLRFTAVGL